MKVYVVEFDNGESYEDQCNWLVGVFSSEEKAHEYLLKERFTQISPNNYSRKNSKYDTYYADITEFEVDKK